MSSFPRKSRPKPDVICRHSSLETEKDLSFTKSKPESPMPLSLLKPFQAPEKISDRPILSATTFKAYLPHITPSLLLRGCDETSVVLAKLTFYERWQMRASMKTNEMMS